LLQWILVLAINVATVIGQFYNSQNFLQTSYDSF
jgi:hypothetical protein